MISQISRMVSSNTPCVEGYVTIRHDKIIFVRLGFGAQIRHVNVAVGVARDGDDFHAGHDGAGGIRAVRGSGDQADVAVRLAARFVIRADDEQAGVFALRTGVRLQRNAREAGDFRQPVFEVAGKGSGSRAPAASGANG